MNRKGFTLIELIVTITLLAIIATISFVSITGVIEENKNKTCKSIETSLKTATLDYISDNRYNPDLKVEITAEDLLDNHYLTGNIKDPYDNSTNLNLSNIKIKVILNNNYEVDKNDNAITVEGLPNNCSK